MELQNGDDSVATGIAQRYPNGDPVWLTTPSLQTNFGPESTAFWQQVYSEMASLMTQAGVGPYLQFGEVQWWYFPGPTATVATEPGMPFYDAYTTATFQATYGQPMSVIRNQYADPSQLPQECAFLPGLIGRLQKRFGSLCARPSPALSSKSYIRLMSTIPRSIKLSTFP
jgi:hypothetical protein